MATRGLHTMLWATCPLFWSKVHHPRPADRPLQSILY